MFTLTWIESGRLIQNQICTFCSQLTIWRILDFFVLRNLGNKPLCVPDKNRKFCSPNCFLKVYAKVTGIDWDQQNISTLLASEYFFDHIFQKLLVQKQFLRSQNQLEWNKTLCFYLKIKWRFVTNAIPERIYMSAVSKVFCVWQNVQAANTLAKFN